MLIMGKVKNGIGVQLVQKNKYFTFHKLLTGILGKLEVLYKFYLSILRDGLITIDI